MSRITLLLATGTSLALGTAAFAQTEVTAATELNLRSGPGAQFEIIGVIPAESPVLTEGCLDAAAWCQVTYEGTTGWASGDYLTSMVENTPVVVYQNRDRVTVGTVTYEDTTEQSALVGAGVGAATGAALGGPVGAIVGAAIGSFGGAAADPGPTVTSYVTSNPVDPIYLDGEIVVGAGLPETVTLVPVPESDYTYAYVNGVPVVVEPASRKVIYIVR